MITYVTCFYNIERVDTGNNKYEDYFKWIHDLLALDIHIYFFTTQDIANKINIHKPNLIYKIIKLDIPNLTEIEIAMKNYNTNAPHKDTPLFAALTHKKFEFIKEAIQDNPFNHEYYGWIDAGLSKIANHIEQLQCIVPTEKIKCMLLNYLPLSWINDNFINQCQYIIAGGFFIGSKKNITYFCDLMIDIVNKDLLKNKYGLEQEYMAIVYKNNLTLFNPYYGDFRDLMDNYCKCQGSKWLVERFMKNAIQYKDDVEIQYVQNYLNQ